MTLAVFVSSVESLSPKMFRKMHKLTHGPEGWMQEDLVFARNSPDRGYTAAVVEVGPTGSKRVLSWALLDLRSGFIQVYTRRSARRQGHAVRAVAPLLRVTDQRPVGLGLGVRVIENAQRGMAASEAFKAAEGEATP